MAKIKYITLARGVNVVRWPGGFTPQVVKVTATTATIDVAKASNDSSIVTESVREYI